MYRRRSFSVSSLCQSATDLCCPGLRKGMSLPCALDELLILETKRRACFTFRLQQTFELGSFRLGSPQLVFNVELVTPYPCLSAKLC